MIHYVLDHVGQLAAFFALAIHALALWLFPKVGHFDLGRFIEPFLQYGGNPSVSASHKITGRIIQAVEYTLFVAMLGLACGGIVAWLIKIGPLRFLAAHAWAYDIVGYTRNKSGFITAFVMTDSIENNKALMYKGILHDFYLTSDGCVSYLVLKSCTKYFLNFDAETPNTSQQLDLFKSVGSDSAPRVWAYLIIQGKNISNILLNKSGQIVPNPQAESDLDGLIQKMREHGETPGDSVTQTATTN